MWIRKESFTAKRERECSDALRKINSAFTVVHGHMVNEIAVFTH